MARTIEEVNNRINELNNYLDNMNFTDDRLVSQIHNELYYLNLEKEDIMYGTHNIEITDLLSSLSFYQQMLKRPHKDNKKVAQEKIDYIYSRLFELNEIDDQIKDQINNEKVKKLAK